MNSTQMYWCGMNTLGRPFNRKAFIAPSTKEYAMKGKDRMVSGL